MPSCGQEHHGHSSWQLRFNAFGQGRAHQKCSRGELAPAASRASENRVWDRGSRFLASTRCRCQTATAALCSPSSAYIQKPGEHRLLTAALNLAGSALPVQQMKHELG